MGRRSINTTKSGKYMNPTDQARKEARKAELKKNKKQRQMVRAAVLKGKDPQQILEEMEKIDQMEFNVNQPSPLNEKVLKDKRKKLRDTLDRVLSMYHKDDQEKFYELKKRQTEYEQKRNQIVAFYESVKTAQSVTVDDIPLPQIPQMGPQSNVHDNIPLPAPAERKTEHTIYSIATALKLQSIGQPVRDPPGCPPGPAPNINDDGEVEEFGRMPVQEEEKEVFVEKDLRKPMNTLQQKMIALSGQNIDEFMKDLESAQQKKAAALKEPEPDRTHLTAHIEVEPLMPPGTAELPSIQILPTSAPTMVPPPLMYTGAGIRLPPGPPPGRPLMPPGPPPGMPPRGLPTGLPLRIPLPPTSNMVRLPGPPLIAATRPAPPVQPNVLSAAPQLINRNESTKHGATISAKPQIRNLSADVTKFVPSALRVKREEKKSRPVTSLVRELKQKEMISLNKSQQGGQHKDDAYKLFMREMESLM